jgi:hypothetical protein
MTDVKISQLPAASVPLTGAEIFPLNQDNVTKQAALTNISSAVIANTNSFIAAGTGAVARTVQSKLRDSVSVSDFGGSVSATPATNAAAITAAIDYALSVSPHLEVQFPEMYDITGYTITIVKPPDYGDRYFLKLTGTGGGIKKTDAGFIFQGATPLVGDIIVTHMSYVSNNNAGTIVWDGNTIIRVFSSFNEYFNIDTVAKQDSTINAQLLQSYRFTHEKITGGRNAAFLWQRASDCTFSNLTIENRQTCFENVLDTGPDINMNQNFNVRITDCVMQGNVYGSAYSIKWGNSWGCTIARNYFENNTYYLDLDTLVRSAHRGLTISGNAFFLSSAQKASGYKPVIVGNLGIISTVSIKSYSNFFSGNISDGELYDFVGSGILNSFGDFSVQQTGFNNLNIVVNSGFSTVTTTAGNAVKKSGVLTSFSFTYTVGSIGAGVTTTLAIAFSDPQINVPMLLGNMYQVYPNQISSINVLGILPVYTTGTSGTLYVTIENRSGGTVTNAVLNILVFQNGD